MDVELVRRGFARSRRDAARLVAEGAVTLDGRPVKKPSASVAPDAAVVVAPDALDSGYASRGAFKLEGVLTALDALGPRVDGASCLDVGASTGGFTDVLLRHGARRVIALDVGHDQLVPDLRDDPRVHAVEGYNARELTARDLPWSPSLVVADVSFISLTLLLPALAATVPRDADLLLMVKPQFEVGRDRLGTGGVVRESGLHAAAVRTVVRAAGVVGMGLRAVVPSPLPGPNGNREFFVWFSPSAPVSDPGAMIERAVAPPEGAEGTVPKGTSRGRASSAPLVRTPQVFWVEEPAPAPSRDAVQDEHRTGGRP
ncbi:TlyA family RNA methyltransferase [Sanguibacter suaedae]|uniref:TlyA family RNA methyltransferase n=1 Tax=Sanguibacter suaedae TaxID=2795737 RepID=A0A934IFX9_9MICO|nr:TlyA family RNA methyltransferase [Sanguibacter suaedae]MBI9116274.1 TlyA family RNA methyltransferase [Sanguibacter suaedae]